MTRPVDTQLSGTDPQYGGPLGAGMQDTPDTPASGHAPCALSRDVVPRAQLKDVVPCAQLKDDTPCALSRDIVPCALSRDVVPCALSWDDRTDRIDPKGVIAESYRIDVIAVAECRSIFLDWVLSTDMPSLGPAAAIAALLDRHGAAHPDHPMTAVLRAGLQDAPQRPRRGGRAARDGTSAAN